MSAIPNVLAERYASAAMRQIWSPEARVILEREFWLSIIKAQRDLGLDIPQEAVEAYERVLHQVNLPSIASRERVTRHDVKARIDEFCELAGHQHIHKGLTSRDLTENVEQLQIYRALQEIQRKTLAALVAISKRAQETADLPLTARTHNVPAQLTTLGKRWAMFGEELLIAYDSLEHLLATYPARGVKGAVGTQLDQMSLLESPERVLELEKRIVHYLGLPAVLENVGQVYPRSLDTRVVNVLLELSSGPSNFAKTLRLMAGQELASEGFAPGQTGSSAMPHKMNSRSCERVNGFQTLLKGYAAMAHSLAGDQWNEGDVSCSVVRRVMLPDAFFALDGLFETFLTILNQMDAYPAMIEAENRRLLPYLLSTTFLMAAVKAGAGREDAHEAIKEHAVGSVKALRQRGETSDLIGLLAADSRLKLSRDTLEALLADGLKAIGAAPQQVAAFVKRVDSLVAQHPEIRNYEPDPIL